MSYSAFIESQSTDPFVREMSRRAVHILNDQTLDRRQREKLVHRLQARLLGHQAKQALKSEQKAVKAAKKGGTEGHARELLQADQRQILALRKQFGSVEQEVPAKSNATILAAIAANDGHYLIRSTSGLTFKGA